MQTDNAPTSSLKLGELASGFCFSKQICQLTTGTVPVFSCQGQPTNLTGPLDLPIGKTFNPEIQATRQPKREK